MYVKQIGTPVEEDAHRLLLGHAGNVTCLAFSEDGSKLVSGGWDSQVFVWDVEAGNVAAELTGHQGPIWGILVYDERFVLTACADKMIRLFDINGKSLKTISGHTDVVRCFAKLSPGHWSGAAFASAGNDEVIRLWTLDGTAMGELHGHEAYIYCLAILPNGDIVSSSEDRTVRVWREGKCIQTITHPAISIWSVAACPETGDIVSGASDKIIRIFSRDPERQADIETVRAFDETNRMYAIPAETASQGQPFQKENLPGPEALQTQSGDRDGQQLFIRENDGSVTAHLWSSSTSQWNLIGTVVEGAGSSSQKKAYEGNDYDFVFDIDIEDGKPPLKLPYNLSESAWDAAKKFLERNELPMSYYEQVANWITENSRGARIGQQSAAPPQEQPDAWGTSKRYRPGDGGANSSTGPRKLPQRSYITILEGNAQNAINKIAEVSKQQQGAGQLADSDLAALQGLVQQLNTSPQDPHPTEGQITTLFTAASTWPVQARVPAIAVLARLAVSPSFVNVTSSGSTTIIDSLSSAGLLAPKQATANNAVHALRLIANLFASDAGKKVLDTSSDSALKLIKPFASDPESPAQYKALAAVYLNYATLLVSSTSSARDATAKTLLIDIATLLECESPHASDPDALYKALVALGTLLTIGGSFKAEIKSGVLGTLHFAQTKPAAQAQNVKEVLLEIREESR